MAFGLKYELLCTTVKGNLYKARIYFDGYTGNPIDRNVPVSPFILKKDKADIIRGTSFNFSIREEADFEFLEFYTNNSKAVKVELYNPSNVLIWTGYNLPQQYQVPYVPCPVNVTFSASDGLGLLKNESFALTGRNSQLDIIRYCVDKIGLGLGYSIAINLFEVSHNHLRTPLEQTFIDSEIFAGLNCYEAIEKILINYNAEITQRRGRWAITRSADKKSARMLYTSAGVYETTEAAPSILDLGYPGTGIYVTPKNSLQFSLEPGGKQVKISHDYGRKDSLLINPDFSKFVSNAFTGWSKLGTFTPEQRFDSNGNPFAFIPGNNDTSDCLYQDIEIEASAGEDFDLSLEMGVLAYRLYGGIPIPIPVDLQFNVALIPVGGTLANAKFLSKDGWKDTLTSVITTVTSQIGGIPKLNKLEIITHEIPFSGTLQVSLYRISATQLYQYTFSGVAWGNVDLKFITADGKLYPTGLETLAEFPDSTEPNNLDDIELLAADAPDLPNARLLYKNITWLSDGSPTTDWPDYSILQQLARSLASDNRVARQKLTGEIKGVIIAFDSIIKHSYNDNREFEISEGEWDIYEETFNVTLLELLAWSNEEVTFSSVDSSSSSSGGSGGSSSSSSSSAISPDITKMGTLAPFFELMNPGETNEYLRVKLAIACDYDFQAYSDFSQFPSSIWESLPIASLTVLGGVKIGTGLSIDSNGILSAAGGMVYPDAGIPLSTGSAWGTSITNNSANWNTAYGWGNHASAGYVTGTPWTSMGYLTSQTYPAVGISLSTGSAWGTSITDNSANWNTAYGWGNHASAGYLTSQTYPGSGIALSTGSAWSTSITDNSANWNTAYSWGNHAIAGYASYPSGLGLAVTTGSAWGSTIATNKVPIFSSAITGTPSSTTYLRGDGSWQTISSGVTPTDNILHWDGTNSWYVPYTTQAAGKFDSSSTNPLHSNRLNYDGNLYTNKLYLTGSGGGVLIFTGKMDSYELIQFNHSLIGPAGDNDNVGIEFNIEGSRKDSVKSFASNSISGLPNYLCISHFHPSALGGIKILVRPGETIAFGHSDTYATTELVLTTTATFSLPVLTAASVAANAGLRIPHGTAPSAPVNGDMWTTTAGLYIRINGTTVGPLN